MSFLQVQSVQKHFGGVAALRGVTFSVEKGEILGLIGANGAGKTTLFTLIAGNQRPSSGTINMDGHELTRLRPDRISRLGVARTFQVVRPFAGMTVLENIAIGQFFGARRERSQTKAKERARTIADQVGLGKLVASQVGSLTLGGLKRLEVGRALACEPRLLLLDEVMAGLTPTEVASAIELIRRLHVQYDLTIIVIEHVMRAVMTLCQRIVVLHHGELIAEGAPTEIANDTRVIEAYLGQ